ncbi:MAG: hypothetical protein ABJG42_24145 [Vibrio splendidus]
MMTSEDIVRRYEAYKVGLQGSLSSALYSYHPLSALQSSNLKTSIDYALVTTSEDIKALIKQAANDSLSESVTELVSISNEDIRKLLSNDSLTALYSETVEEATHLILSRMRQDAFEVTRLHHEFRLKVNLRAYDGTDKIEHVIVGERERLLLGFSPKQTDSMGRRYDSSNYVERIINYMVASVHRQAMFFALLSLGHEKAVVSGGSYDGKVILLDNFFELEPKIFHYGSKARLKPDVTGELNGM